MEKDILYRKGLVIAFILLFIGLAVAPSINANLEEEEMVEYTTEFCGFGGGKRTIKLTLEEANDLEQLLMDSQFQFNNIESYMEAKEIISETINELDEYGVLDDMPVKLVQRLILGGIVRQLLIDRIMEKYVNDNISKNVNRYCLISGYSKAVNFHRMPYYWLYINDYYDNIFIYLFSGMVEIPYNINPFKILSVVTIGHGGWTFEGPSACLYGNGIISSIGLNGIKNWIGKFKGNVDTMYYEFFLSGSYEYVGIIGFTGIQLSRIDKMVSSTHTFLLGSAINVNITNV